MAGMLGCWLNEWFVNGRAEHSKPVCKAWDLRAAYKQLPLSDSSYELDSYFLIFNCETNAKEVYRQRVLPFGSTASVTSFIRAGCALWKLGASGLDLVWTEYFDDYLSVCGQAFAKHTDFVVSIFFQVAWVGDFQGQGAQLRLNVRGIRCADQLARCEAWFVLPAKHRKTPCRSVA